MVHRFTLAVCTALTSAVIAACSPSVPPAELTTPSRAPADASGSATPSASTSSSTSASPTPPTPATSPPASPSPSAPSPAPPAAPGTALAALARLVVKGRAPKTGYARSKFGIPWRDVDGNGCSTRNDVLAASLRDIRRVGCRVVSGYLDDPYTGTTVPQGFRTIEIDHMVALSDAWQKGAQQWDASKRERFANDPLNLQPTLPRVNSQKSDSDAASWLPSNRSYRCQYVARLIAVKKKYGLWVTSAERAAMERVLGTCPAEPLPARPR